MSDLLTEAKTALCSWYGDMNSTDCASWILLNLEKGEINTKRPSVCHASMRYDRPSLWSEMLTAVPNGDTLSIKYLKWLIDGPFRLYSDYIKLEQMPDKGAYYLYITDLDKFPANALFNFCIASRMPIEQPEIIHKWSKLTDLGLSDTLGFLVAGMSGNAIFPQDLTLESRLACFGPMHTGHWWYDMSSDWSLIIQGTPTKLSDPYMEAPDQVTPCNVIWGHRPADITYNLFNLTLGEIKEDHNE